MSHMMAIHSGKADYVGILLYDLYRNSKECNKLCHAQLIEGSFGILFAYAPPLQVNTYC